jgi:hypothetical protein
MDTHRNIVGTEARCVKCVGKHHTKECQKPEQSHPKCVHYGEARPANYSGCVVAKELQKIRNNAIRRRRISCVKMQKDRNTKRNAHMSK